MNTTNAKPAPTAHTPGPFSIRWTNGQWEITAGEFPHARTVAIVFDLEEGDEANARLIAAAPEMADKLSLLICTVWDTFRHRGLDSQWEALESVTKEAAQLLARAEGR